jgi:hypothetical protein
MILLFALVVAFVVGLLRGGKLLGLASLPLRWPAVPLLAFAAQAVVMFLPGRRGEGLWSLHAGLLVISYLALLLTVWVNRRIAGMGLLGLGLILNLAVMLTNGGYMPVTPEMMPRIGYDHLGGAQAGERLVGSKSVILPREQTRLWILSDIFAFSFPFPLCGAFSMGDVLIAVGAFRIVQSALLGPKLRCWGARGMEREDSGAASPAINLPSDRASGLLGSD